MKHLEIVGVICTRGLDEREDQFYDKLIEALEEKIEEHQ